jgi:hypothetical protein
MATVTVSRGQVRRYAGHEGEQPATAVTGSEFYNFDTGITECFDGESWIVEQDTAWMMRELLRYANEQTSLMQQTLDEVRLLSQAIQGPS